MATILPLLDPEILDAIRSVQDPEMGVSIVDLGLVYRAERENRLSVEITLTSRSCPLGEYILDQVVDALRARFGHAVGVDAALVWEPRWQPEMASSDLRNTFC